jgi:hypothetical protein
MQQLIIGIGTAIQFVIGPYRYQKLVAFKVVSSVKYECVNNQPLNSPTLNYNYLLHFDYFDLIS